MAMRTYLGDRRTGLRFQVKGELWASVDMNDDVVLRDITPAGALVETTLLGELESLRAATLRLPGGPELTAHVRHVSALDRALGGRCLVGVEFVNMTDADRQALGAFIHSLKSRHRRPS